MPRTNPGLTTFTGIGYSCRLVRAAKICLIGHAGSRLRQQRQQPMMAAVLYARRNEVKPGIHPKYEDVTVHCACGASWTTRSTKKELSIEICSHCHPFYTGKQKLVDTAGRVERFQRKYGRKVTNEIGTE